MCVCVCGEAGGALSLASAQCVQQLQLSASVYTVGAILLSERLIDTKSRMVIRGDSEVRADGAFRMHSAAAIQHLYEAKKKKTWCRVKR